MNRPEILCVGEVLWDLFPTGPRFGGAPANLACHAALLGGKVAIVSAIGDDPRGQEALTVLRGFGVDVSLVQTLAAVPTGSVSVTLDASGRPSFKIQNDSAWDQIILTPDLAAKLADVKVVCFGTLGQRSQVSRTTIRHALEIAKQRAIRRVLDVNLRKPFYDPALIRHSISLASVLKFSEQELGEICSACRLSDGYDAGRILVALRDLYNLELVVMTRGADGALLVSEREKVNQPGVPITVRDTVGAGDAFTAAMVVGLLKGDSLREIALSACKTASLVCGHAGAVPAFPKSMAAMAASRLPLG